MLPGYHQHISMKQKPKCIKTVQLFKILTWWKEIDTVSVQSLWHGASHFPPAETEPRAPRINFNLKPSTTLTCEDGHHFPKHKGKWGRRESSRRSLTCDLLHVVFVKTKRTLKPKPEKNHESQYRSVGHEIQEIHIWKLQTERTWTVLQYIFLNISLVV